MRDLLEGKLARFEALEKDLLDPEILSNSKKLAATAREHGSLMKMATKYRNFQTLIREIDEAQEMLASDDKELKELAEMEIPELKEKRELLWNDLLEMTIGGEDANRSRIIVEVRAGTGGDEAALFARDLYEMYKTYCESQKWKIEILSHNTNEVGGFKEISFAVAGEGCFRIFQYESGGHRVQRVPQTETQGRIHTSAATVAAMPEPEEIEVNIKPDDYRVDTFNASGPGGQHVNKTESAIRLTHFETGIVVQCQDEKSQLKNKTKALRELAARVYTKLKEIEHEKRADQRRSLVGSGDRSQRIRTYNFPENRVTDHRIGLSIYKLDQILQGQLHHLTEKLIDHDRQQLRESMGTGD